MSEAGRPPDDRAAFAAERRENIAALGGDTDLQRMAQETMAAADRHNYSYVWNWLGLPIIQTPTDIAIAQEIIWECRPQVIIETGVARGGSVILYSSLLELIGEGVVVAIDIDIRPHNRAAIEAHPLAHRVRLMEGSSTNPETVRAVQQNIDPGTRVMVILDSNHTHDHVRRELELYSPLVTPGQFLVVADTIVEYLPPQNHRPRPWGPGNNPKTALDTFLAETTRFVIDPINSKLLLSSSPGGYLRCTG